VDVFAISIHLKTNSTAGYTSRGQMLMPADYHNEKTVISVLQCVKRYHYSPNYYPNYTKSPNVSPVSHHDSWMCFFF